MNVANRKLFANRDARKKLAAMGGIMASSPELLGEAQLYQQGGSVDVPTSERSFGQTYIGDPLRNLLQPVGDRAREIGQPIGDTMRGLFSTPQSAIEVPGYLDTYEDPAKADLVAALNQSAQGARFADALNSAGQGAWDMASKAFSSAAAAVGGTGLQVDALLGVAVGNALSFAGFPEKGAEMIAGSREEAAFGRDMVDGKFNVLGQSTESFQIPEAGRRMYDAAAVERKLTADPTLAAEGGVSEPLSDIPESIIQSRITDSPEAMTMAPAGLESPPEVSLGLGRMPASLTQPDQIARPRGLTKFDDSTGVPLSMEEIQAQMFERRLREADQQQTAEEEFGAMGMPERAMPGGPGVGLMYPPEEDRFPSEDLRLAAQEAALADVRNNTTSTQERMVMTGYEETAAKNAAAAKMEREARKSAEEAAAARDAAGITSSLTKEERDAQLEEIRIRNAERRNPDVPSLVETATDPDKSTQQRNADAATDALKLLGVPNPEDMSPKQRVNSYEKMFKEMLGEDDEDTASEMWHNMAMIGFAIAAGEDPNALTNISRGLLEGTKMMKEDRGTKRKRKDAITTMAIEAGLADERSAQKFGRDLTLASMRSSQTGTQEPFVDAVRVLAQKGLDSGTYTTMEEALGAAAAALRPYYGEVPAAKPKPTQTAQQAEAAAKASGKTEFVWNGNRYPVR